MIDSTYFSPTKLDIFQNCVKLFDGILYKNEKLVKHYKQYLQKYANVNILINLILFWHFKLNINHGQTFAHLTAHITYKMMIYLNERKSAHLRGKIKDFHKICFRFVICCSFVIT